VSKTESGLRERKKAQTRARIASVAADLFARDGYENTTMTQIAAEAAVSEQTVYNYFPVKEALVFDLQEEFDVHLLAAIRERSPQTSVIQAFRSWLRQTLPDDTLLRASDSQGGMPVLIAHSDVLRRHWLARNDASASAIAAELTECEGWPRVRAITLARALIAVYATFIEALGAGEVANPTDFTVLRTQIDDAFDMLGMTGL